MFLGQIFVNYFFLARKIYILSIYATKTAPQPISGKQKNNGVYVVIFAKISSKKYLQKYIRPGAIHVTAARGCRKARTLSDEYRGLQ